MARAGSAFIDFEGKFDGLSRDAAREAKLAGGKAGSSFTSSFSSKMSGISQKFRDTGKSMMTAGAGMTAGITAPVVLGFKKAFDAASDLNENLSKTRAVFGDDATIAIEKFARSAATSVGLSESAALEATSTFGNMFVQLGIGSSTAGDMSTEMVTLASDFASFHNADISDVIDAQSAAFRGEYDAVQRFVPTINAAAVEQEALAMTGKATTKELTAQEKALAVQKLMMEGAGDAVGDFARTSDGAANKQRILKARFEDTSASIGEKLLPIGEKLLGWVGKLLDKFTGLSPTMQNVVLGALGIAAAIGPVVGVVGALVTGIGLLLTPVGLVVAAVAALAAGAVYAYTRFDGFRAVVDRVASSLRDGLGAAIKWITGTAIPGIKAAVGSFIAGFRGQGGDDFFSRLGDAARTAWNFIVVTAIPGIKQAVGSFIAGLRGESGGQGSFFADLGNTIRGVVTFIRETVIPTWQRFAATMADAIGRLAPAIPLIKTVGLVLLGLAAAVLFPVTAIIVLYQRFEWFRTVVGVVMGVVGQLIQNAFTTIGVIFNAIAGIISGVLVPVWLMMLGVWRTVWSGVSAAISAAWSFIQPVVNALANFIRDWLIPRFREFQIGAQVVWAAVSAAISTAWAFVQPILGALVGFIGGVLAGAFRAFMAVAQTVWGAVSGAISAAWGFISPILGALVGFFGGALAGAFQAFLGVAQTVWSAVSAAISGAWSFIQPVLAAVIGFITGPVAGAFQSFLGVAQTVWTAVTGAISAAWGFVQPILQAVIGFLGGALTAAFNAFLGVAQFVWSLVFAAVRDAWGFIQPILQAVIGFLANQVTFAFNAFMGVARFVWEAVSGAISAAWNFFRPIIQAVIDFLDGPLSSTFDAFMATAQFVWGAVSSAVSGAWNFVKPIFEKIISFIGSDLVPVWDSITRAVETAFSAIPGIISGALRTAGGIVSGFLNAAAGIADAIGLDDIASALRTGANAAGRWGDNVGAGGGGGARRGGGTYQRASGGLVDGPIPVGAGFKTNGALAVVGEGRPQWPEFVIPTDPQYRSRALGLWESAGAKLMGIGGTLGNAWDKAKSAGGAIVDWATSAGGAVVDWGKDKLGDMLDVSRRIIAGAVEALPPGKLPVPNNFTGVVPGAFNKIRDKVIEVIRGKAEEEQKKAEMAAGSLTGGGFTPGGGGGAAGSYTPGMQAARRDVLAAFGGMTVGGYVNRNVAGTSKLSDHARWRAWDFMVGMGAVPRGNAIAAHLLANAARYGLKNLIWNDKSNNGGGWRPYRHPAGGNNNTLQHRDHVHAGFFAGGGTLPMTVHRQPFDLGGVLAPGWNAVRNDLGRDEPVSPGVKGPLVGTMIVQNPEDVDMFWRRAAFAGATG